MNKKNLPIVAIIFITITVSYWTINDQQPANFYEFWQTPDQMGQAAFDRQDYKKAAELFSDPMRKGSAYYRDAQFKMASAQFATIHSAEAFYNRGTSLIMQGLYPEAILSFDQALTLEKDYPNAAYNRELARLRQAERDKAAESRAEQGVTNEGADDIVFDKNQKKGPGGDDVEIDSQKLGGKELNAVWLRQVESRPADFLRLKFAYQLFKKEQEK